MLKKLIALALVLTTLLFSFSISSFAQSSSVAGDIDGDGEITTTDFLRIKNHLLGISAFESSLSNADFNGDGEITTTDYLNIKLLWLDNSEEANPEEIADETVSDDSFENTVSEGTSGSTPPEDTSDGEEPTKPANKTITLYVPDYENEALKAYRAFYNGTIEGVIEALQSMNALPEGTDVLGFEIEDNTAIIDLSEEFGIALNNARTGEWIFLASLANTVIDCYGTEYFFFTVEGEIFETGLNIYDSPIEFAQSVTLYVPNDDFSNINKHKTVFNGMAEGLISKFVTIGVLPQGTELYSFEIDGDTVKVDLSEEFGIALNNARANEQILLGAVANTFIEFYGVKYFEFTVNGEILETGLTIYDFPIEFTERITLYVPNNDFSDFEKYASFFNGTAEDLVAKLTAVGVLPQGTELYSFEIDEDTVKVDLSEEFGIALNNARANEQILLGAVANTFIEFYGVKYFEFTVKGEILETGLTVYDFPIEFTECITLYVPNNDFSDFEKYASFFNGTAEDLVAKLTAVGVLPQGTELYSFEIDGDTVKVNFSEEFGIALNNARTGEYILIGAVANTFIEFYGTTYFEFTGKGAIFETGLTIYDFPIEFYSVS